MPDRHAQRVACRARRAWRPIALLGAILAVCGLGGAALAQPEATASAAPDPWRIRGAGSSERGWILLPSSARAAGVETVGLLYHVPTEEPPGTVRRAPGHAVAEPPTALAAFDDQITLVFPPPRREASEEQDGAAGAPIERGRPVRAVRVAGRDPTGAYLFEPTGRLRALPSLPRGGRLLGFAESQTGLAALLAPGRAETTAGRRGARLLLLDDTAWREAPLPGGVERADLTLLTVGRALALLAVDEAGEATLWRQRPPAASDGDADPSWVAEPVAPPPAGAQVLGVGAQVAALTHAPTGAMRIELLSLRERRALAEVQGVPADHAAFAAGEDIAMVWTDTEADGRLRIAVVSSVTGRVLHDDFAKVAPPVSAEDLRFLALLLGAVMLGVLVFILRPESLARATHPPPGFAPAEPGRRLVAAAVDFIVGGLVSAAILGASLGEALNPSYILLLQGGGAAPVLTTIGVTFLHSVPAEALTGRTLGKALAGCRTVRVDGRRPALWQAAVRTAIKLAAPPLTALLLLDPLRRHPGDVVAGTLVVVPASPPAKDEPEADRDSSESDDRA